MEAAWLRQHFGARSWACCPRPRPRRHPGSVPVPTPINLYFLTATMPKKETGLTREISPLRRPGDIAVMLRPY